MPRGATIQNAETKGGYILENEFFWRGYSWENEKGAMAVGEERLWDDV